MYKEYVFVSCDIIAHSDELNLDVQRERVAAVNRIVRQILMAAPEESMVWSSGGDGGHLAIPIGPPSHLAIELILLLREWSIRCNVPLRVTANDGIAECVEGADGRVQLAGFGINLAGRLNRLGGETRVIVTEGFLNCIRDSLPSGIKFHDERLIQPAGSNEQKVFLLSAEGQFESYWDDHPEHSDIELLRNALEATNGLEVIYRARRLFEINPKDSEPINALRLLSLSRSRVTWRQNFLRDLVLDEQFGFQVIRAGDLVERHKGDLLCRFNDEGETMFLILKGRVGVFLPRPEHQHIPGFTKPDFVMPPGDLVGELAFALRRRRTATLRCMDDASLLAFRYNDILAALGESTVKEEVARIIDRKVLARIVENVWNTTPYFGHMTTSGVLAKLVAPWLSLLSFSSVTSISWNKGAVDLANQISGDVGLCILVSGRLASGGDILTVLDGVEYPILFADFQGEITTPAQRYKLLEDVKLLTITREGIFSLGSPAYDEIARRVAERLQTTPQNRKRISTKRHVFLSYCRDDADLVARLHDELIAAGEHVWWDRSIGGGMDWKLAIQQALQDSYAFVVCFSQNVEKRKMSGVNPEILDAIALYREYIPGSVFLIPVRLSQCEIPKLEIDSTRTLDRLQRIDLFPAWQRANGIQQLLQAIRDSPHHP